MSDEQLALDLIAFLRKSRNKILFYPSMQIIESLDLKSLYCDLCGRKIDFFKYHWNRGMCFDCIEKALVEIRERYSL